MASSTPQAVQAAPVSPYRFKDFFSYSTVFSALANGGNATNNINIQADSDFRIEKITYFANIANAAQTASTLNAPNVSLLLTDSGSGRQLSDAAIPLYATAGTGQWPFILPTPKLLSARATLVVTATNFDAADTFNLWIVFHGTKLFY